MQYKARRIVVEATQLTTKDRYALEPDGKTLSMLITIGEDDVRAYPNDWIVRLADNEWEVLSPEAFTSKYEPFGESPEEYGRIHSTEEAREMELNQGDKKEEPK